MMSQRSLGNIVNSHEAEVVRLVSHKDFDKILILSPALKGKKKLEPDRDYLP